MPAQPAPPHFARQVRGRHSCDRRRAGTAHERPPLSKDYLTGGKPFERLLLRPESFWAERNIEFRLGTTVAAVDPANQTVETDASDKVACQHLVWATGGAPQRLSCDGHLKQGRVIALDCVNAIKDYVQGGKLVVEGAVVDPARLADAATPLKDLVG